jgi:hypothetical protein
MHPRRRGTWLSLLLGAVLLPLGCGGGASPPAPTSDAAPADDGASTFAGCGGDPRSDSFALGLSKAAFGGRLKLKLLAADPGPPIKGTNAWTVEVDDAQGAAQAGAVIKVMTYMPDHGHSSPITPIVTAMADGRYGIAPLYFFMAGLWQVTLDVTTSAGVNDAGMFSFCVDR